MNIVIFCPKFPPYSTTSPINLECCTVSPISRGCVYEEQKAKHIVIQGRSERHRRNWTRSGATCVTGMQRWIDFGCDRRVPKLPNHAEHYSPPNLACRLFVYRPTSQELQNILLRTGDNGKQEKSGVSELSLGWRVDRLQPLYLQIVMF